MRPEGRGAKVTARGAYSRRQGWEPGTKGYRVAERWRSGGVESHCGMSSRVGAVSGQGQAGTTAVLISHKEFGLKVKIVGRVGSH